MYIIDLKKILRFVVMIAIIISSVIGSRGYVQQVAKVSGRSELPIYSVARDDKKIAISFDTAWGNEDIDKILQVLEENHVKATFFIVGIWVRKYPEDMKKILAAGHEIGNHSDTHPHIIKLNKEGIKNQIMKNHKEVKELLDYDMKLFRSPYGEHNDLIVKTTRALDYEIVKWDVDSWDWMEKSEDFVINRVVNNKNLGSGSIILMHSGAKHTANILDRILKDLKGKGYEFVKMRDIVYWDDYRLDHRGKQFKIEKEKKKESNESEENKNNQENLE